MACRHDAAAIGQERPALAVRFPNGGSRQSSAIDNNLIGNFDTLAGKCHDGFDQRRDTASTKPKAQIATLARFLECGRRRQADEDQIADLDRTPKRLDAPEPEGLARRQVQAIATDIGDRRQTDRDDPRTRQKLNYSSPSHCFSTGVWRWVRCCSSACLSDCTVRS